LFAIKSIYTPSTTGIVPVTVEILFVIVVSAIPKGRFWKVNPGIHHVHIIVSPVLLAQISAVFVNVAPHVINDGIVATNVILPVCPGAKVPIIRPVCAPTKCNCAGKSSRIYTPETVLPHMFP
jgi:hypothetical protein